MSILALKPHHLPDVLGLAAEDPLAWPEAAWHSSVQAGEVFGLYHKHQLVAVLALREGYLELEVLYLLVAKSLRQQGLAKRLLVFAEQQARAKQAERLLLEVRASNSAALALYQKQGFIQDGRRKNYYASQASPTGKEDALLMSLSLLKTS